MPTTTAVAANSEQGTLTASTGKFSLKTAIDEEGQERDFIEGFLATTHIDKGNDQFTEDALKQMAEDIREANTEVDAVFNDVDMDALREAQVGNLDHNNNPASPFGDTRAVPAFKTVDAELRPTGDGEKGLHIKAVLNSDGMLPETVSAVKNSIRDNFLNAFSVEFVPEKVRQVMEGGRAVRIIESAMAKGAALTGRPMNSNASMTDAQLKSITREYKVEYAFSVGDEVEWNETGGTIRDRTKDSCFNEEIDGDFEVCGEQENPAYLIEVDNEEGTMVGHKQDFLVEEGNKAAHTDEKASVPMPESVQLLYPSRERAEEAGEMLGLSGSHTHELDGETWYMPGDTHTQFVNAMEGMDDMAAQHMEEEEEMKQLTEEQRTPPEAAQDNAQMFLDAKEEGKVPDSCGTGTGSRRAEQIASGDPLSEDVIEDIASFARHEDNKEADVDEGESKWQDCGYSMWKAWGGDEGVRWAQDKNEMMDEAKTVESKADFTVQTPEYTAASDSGQWERPDMQDFPDDYDPMNIFIMTTDSDDFSDQSLPVVDMRDGEPTLVRGGLESAHTVAARVEGASEDEIERARNKIEQLAEDEFDLMLDRDSDSQHSKNDVTMTDEEPEPEEGDEPEAGEEESGEEEAKSVSEEIEELKSMTEELKDTNESLRDENEELKSELEDLRQLQEIKSEVDEVKSLLDDVELEDGPRARQEQKRFEEEDESKAEWKKAADRVGSDYLKSRGNSKSNIEAFAENHGVSTEEVKNYVDED